MRGTARSVQVGGDGRSNKISSKSMTDSSFRVRRRAQNDESVNEKRAAGLIRAGLLQRPAFAILTADVALGNIRRGTQFGGIPGDALAGADGDVAQQGHFRERAGIVE